jgi:hypothetical protein
MTRDDLEACLQAYQFGELVLGGLLQKTEKERRESVVAAERLRAGVQGGFERVLASVGEYEPARVERLKAAKEQLDARLTDAARALTVE